MRRLTVALLTGVLAYGTALAQEAETPAADTLTAGAPDETLDEAASLSNADKRTRAEQMLVEMREALQRATDVLGEARASKDVVQLNCVNEKLVQIKGLLKIGEQSSVRMYEGVAQDASDVVNHEYTKLAVAHQRTLVLRSEADQCVGESTIYTGDTEIEVEVDPSLREGDPTASPYPEVAPETPEVASTF